MCMGGERRKRNVRKRDGELERNSRQEAEEEKEQEG